MKMNFARMVAISKLALRDFDCFVLSHREFNMKCDQNQEILNVLGPTTFKLLIGTISLRICIGWAASSDGRVFDSRFH